MGYNPVFCWADLDLENFGCPLGAFTNKGCKGGVACTHRGNYDTRQCENAISKNNDIGMCDSCYRKFVGSLVEV